MLVKLQDAAWLVSRHERVVRRRLLIPKGEDGHLEANKDGNVWMIDTDALAQFWRIDAARRDELLRRERRSPDVMAARLEALEREVAALRMRVRTLEMLNSHQTRSEPNLTAQAATDTQIDSYAPVSHPSAFSVSPAPLRMRHTSMGDTGAFDNRAVAARWLVTHGVNSEGTPKSWPGWRDLEGQDLTPSHVLQLAMRLREEADRQRNHRVIWRLHPCSDEACVCRELLASSGLTYPAGVEG